MVYHLICSSKLTFSRFLVASCIRAPNIELKIENMKVKKWKKVYFLPSNWPMRASHLPHLWSVTPRYFELPLANPVLCLRSMCTNSSFVRFLIWCLIKKWTKESININIKKKKQLFLQIIPVLLATFCKITPNSHLQPYFSRPNWGNDTPYWFRMFSKVITWKNILCWKFWQLLGVICKCINYTWTLGGKKHKIKIKLPWPASDPRHSRWGWNWCQHLALEI